MAILENSKFTLYILTNNLCYYQYSFTSLRGALGFLYTNFDSLICLAKMYKSFNIYIERKEK